MSSVVSAALVFSLITTMMVLWTVQTLPEWVADREESHQIRVVESMGHLRGGLDSLSASDEQGPVRASFAVTAPPIPLLQAGRTMGTLEVQEGLGFQATFTDPRIHAIGSTPLTAPTEPIDGDTVTDVASLRMLHVQVASSGIVDATKTATVKASFTDGVDVVSASVHHGFHGDCGNGTALLVQVTDIVVREHLVACGLGASLSGRTVDLLQSPFGLGAGIARLDGPLTASFEAAQTGGALGSGTVAALWTDGSGHTRTLGSGATAPYAFDGEGVAVVHSPNYQEHQDQELRWELGALIRKQAQGSVVLADPAFSVAVDGSTGLLRWTIVDLGGTGSIGGIGVGEVAVTHLGTTRVVLDVSGATFTMDGVTGPAWRTYLSDTMQLAGASGSATIVASDDTATLTLGGGSITRWSLDLRIVEAEAKVS